MVIILVGMSSMKSFYKKKQNKKQKTGASKKKWARTESFLFCPFLSGGLDVPITYWSRLC